MHIKSIVAGTAIALAATIGSASADDQFATMDGIAAEALTTQAMGRVKGQLFLLHVEVPVSGAEFPGAASFQAPVAGTLGILATDQPALDFAGGVIPTPVIATFTVTP